jgi:ABC-type antimicrobial peptide transport system permease subunit
VNDFSLWFFTGLEHIADLKGYDHILFLLALCGVYEWRQWKNLLVLVTAFTIGHSISLAFSVLDIVKADTEWVEFLIPVTILITCIYNLRRLDIAAQTSFRLNYFFALFFGIIHGLGFSTLLKSLLGSAENIVMPLLAFNLGLEAGQILIVLLVLLISVILAATFRVQRRNWNFFLSSAVFGIAFLMALERLSFLFE